MNKPRAQRIKRPGFLLALVTEGAKPVAVIGSFFAFIGLLLSVLLYANLRTDIEELLPDTARSVRDMVQATSRLHSIENTVILVFSDKPENSKRFVEDLAKKINQLPKSLVARVEYKIDTELKFFKDRQALFMDLADLIKVRDYIGQRIDFEIKKRKKKIPKDTPPPEFDFDSLKKKYSSKLSDFDHFPDGYYATKDEKVRALVIYMPGKGLDLAQQMTDALHKTVDQLNPKAYGPDLQVKFTGNIQNLLEESAALVEDLLFSTVVVTALVVIGMLFFYRSTWATLLLVLSLFMGTFWCFGLAYLLVGYLNANTAFLASIVIGNGINFGIIFLARYLEERRMGKNNYEAIDVTLRSTTTATATAALGAGLSYGSLILTGFRGFSQFGVIGLIGMVLCWISSYTLLPAFLTLLDKRLGKRWIIQPAGTPVISRFFAGVVKKFPEGLLLFSVVAVLLSISTLANYKQELIETDLSKLRDKRSVEHGSGSLYHYIDDIFGHSVSPMAILTQNPEDAKTIADLLRQEQKKYGDKSIITNVQTLADFLPTDQREKARVIGQIKNYLTPYVRKHIPPEDQKLAEIFTNPASDRIFREKDLSPLLMVRFREANGAVGNIVLVDKQIERGGDSSQALTYFVNTGRDIADRVEPGALVAGGLPITFDMYEAIVHDGPRATAFAFLAVIILVILLFKNVRIIGLALFTLLVGVIWLAGLILGLHLKINFLNFIALPITFGIGIDYGVNILQRYREDGASSIVKVIQNTGGAVLLCSFTTIVGYSSLLIAGNQAFVSFGRLAVLGEITCVIAATMTLPAYLLFVSRYKRYL